MLWIGLTGAMGSGKSTVAKVLREKGFPVLDADQVVHDLLKPGYVLAGDLISTFGQSVRDPQGNLNRHALGKLVFTNKTKLDQLEALLHPKVREEVARLKANLLKNGTPAAFYDVPLLFEKNMETQFDFILVVSADDVVRRERIQRRMNLSLEDILAREQKHVSPEIKARKASAVIVNDSSMEKLEREIDSALNKIGVASPAVRNS